MTHKQQAIEALNKLHHYIDGHMRAEFTNRAHELIRDLRAHITLMEPVENPAKLPDTMPRVPMPRGPISLDAEEEPVLECSRCVHTTTELPYQHPVAAVDEAGHKQCPSCGDRNNLRKRQ